MRAPEPAQFIDEVSWKVAGRLLPCEGVEANPDTDTVPPPSPKRSVVRGSRRGCGLSSTW
jgi:hypothetical protein